MPASILKQCIDIYIDPLPYLINVSINQGIFPSELKIANVIPFTNQMKNNLYGITDQYLFYCSSLKKIEKIISNHLLKIKTTYYMIISSASVRIIQSSQDYITLVERVSKALDTGSSVFGSLKSF